MTHNKNEVKTAIAQAVPRLLLDRHQAAQALGVSDRTFNDLIGADFMPVPVQLGPRLLRWSLAELQNAIAAMPRMQERQEPLRDRIARLKAGSASCSGHKRSDCVPGSRS